MKSYTNYHQSSVQPPKSNNPDFQQYHYDAMYKVKYDEFIKRLSGFFRELAPEFDMTTLDHNTYRHDDYKNRRYLHCFTKESQSNYRLYMLDINGTWREFTTGNYLATSHEVTDDTLKAFVIDVRNEYNYRKQEGTQ